MFDGIVDKSTVYDWIFNNLSGRVTTYEKLCNTGIKGLDKIFHFRTGEVTTLFADTSVGKSSLLRWLSANLLYQDIRVLVVATEEPPKVWTLKVTASLLGTNSHKLSDDTSHKVASYVNERFIVANCMGTISVESLAEIVEYGVRENDVKIVIFDNVTAATADSDNMLSLIAGIWTGTAAITSISIAPYYGTLFAQYSSATLYGIRKY